jgi:hypothetical protein
MTHLKKKKKKVSWKSCRENENTGFRLNNFFLKICHSEIMWKNMVEPERPQMTV